MPGIIFKFCWTIIKDGFYYRVATSPGIGFIPWKASWKIGKLDESPGKVLIFFFEKSIFSIFFFSTKSF